MRHSIVIAMLAAAGCGTVVTFEFRDADNHHPIVGAEVENIPLVYMDVLMRAKSKRGITDDRGRWTATLSNDPHSAVINHQGHRYRFGQLLGFEYRERGWFTGIAIGESLGSTDRRIEGRAYTEN